jgi:hypothetical protein
MHIPATPWGTYWHMWKCFRRQTSCWLTHHFNNFISHRAIPLQFFLFVSTYVYSFSFPLLYSSLYLFSSICFIFFSFHLLFSQLMVFWCIFSLSLTNILNSFFSFEYIHLLFSSTCIPSFYCLSIFFYPLTRQHLATFLNLSYVLYNRWKLVR